MLRKFLTLSACLALLGGAAGIARASDNPALDDAVRQVQAKWETIKFEVPEGDRQTDLMNALGKEADALVTHFPGRVEALIWDGVVTSERASMASPLTALGLAKRARDLLEQAYKIDPGVLDSGATTSLGVLYYRVPGFPIAFGDKARARQLLEQAVRLSPQGMDALYFYGDFLMSQNENAQAIVVFQRALKLPPQKDRPLWDKNRRLMIEELLEKMKA